MVVTCCSFYLFLPVLGVVKAVHPVLAMFTCTGCAGCAQMGHYSSHILHVELSLPFVWRISHTSERRGNNLSSCSTGGAGIF